MIIFKKKEKNKSYLVSFCDFIVNHYLHNRSNKLLGEDKKQLLVFAFDHIAHKINLKGIYEKEELEFLIDWIKTKHHHLFKGTAIDIGANIGNHSLFFADYFYKVKSFEPNIRTYQALYANSKLSNNIETFNFGISDQEQSLLLNVSKNNVGGSFLLEKRNNNTEVNADLVQLFKLDTVLDENEKITLMKIDVEGHESKVLKGAKNIIEKHKPLILFELNLNAFINGQSEEIAILKKYGYNKFATIESTPRVFSRGQNRLQRIVNFVFSNEKCIVIKDDIKPDNYYFIIAIPENL